MVAMADSRFHNSIRWLAARRAWVQTAFLLVWLDPLMLRLHHVCGPVFHCYSCPLATFACPMGVIAHFSALHYWPFAAIGVLVLVGATVGNAVCGWACPFGFLQDLVGRVPTPKIRLPHWLGYTPYLVLIGLVIAVPYLWGAAHALFFCRVCPAGGLEGAIPFMIRTASSGGGWHWPSTAKLVILGGTLAAMLFTLRPWCTLLCPLGAIFSIFNRASIMTLRFKPNTCGGCGQCTRLCRYGVLPNHDVNNGRCIRCLECTRCNSIKVSTVFIPLAPLEEVVQGPAGNHCRQACPPNQPGDENTTCNFCGTGASIE